MKIENNNSIKSIKNLSYKVEEVNGDKNARLTKKEANGFFYFSAHSGVFGDGNWSLDDGCPENDLVAKIYGC